MDRLSKALDLARGKRERVSASSGKRRSPNIDYSQTQVMKASPNTLDISRIIGINESEGPLVDAYRLLRTRLVHRMEQRSWKTLGVTSPGPKEGKTLTAINLAISIAKEGKYTVMLIDADLRRPAVHRYFGIAPEHGILEYLTADLPLERILVSPGVDRLVVVPGRRSSAGASEHLSSPGMRQLVEEVRERYPNRLIIFDLPPVLIGDDVVTFSPMIDALLFVVLDGKTVKTELEKASELVKEQDVVGVVLNQTEDQIQSYDYYTRYA